MRCARHSQVWQYKLTILTDWADENRVVDVSYRERDREISWDEFVDGLRLAWLHPATSVWSATSMRQPQSLAQHNIRPTTLLCTRRQQKTMKG
jgi:hypothetical protein